MPTIQTIRRKTGNPVQVRVEMLQEVCQRMAAGDQGLQLDFGTGFSHASRYGFKVSVG